MKHRTLTWHDMRAHPISSYRREDNDWSYAPSSWIKRADEFGWAHLMAKTDPAPLSCFARGKLICLYAGCNLLVLSPALETNIIGMPLQTYRDIAMNDCPGSNKTRAEELRTLVIPKEYVRPHSSRVDTPRTIKILAAFVSRDWAWAINDFSTLAQMYIFTKDTPWDRELRPGTSLWDFVFARFTGGPDWFLEPVDALLKLREWRSSVLKASKCHERYCQKQISSYFGLAPQEVDSPCTGYGYNRPILQELLKNRNGCFAGIGRYSANDLLYTLGIYPGTPSRVICSDPALYAAFETGLQNYLAQFGTEPFLSRASSVPNTTNPFDFNEHLNSEFLRKWVLVYRRSMAVMSAKLYNFYASRGLFDENHIIGGAYVPNCNQLLDINRRVRKYVPVFFCEDPLAAYTVIRAKIPREWGCDVSRTRVVDDIKRFTYSTTIGTAQFRVPLDNRPFFHDKEPGTLIIGRPRIERTGKVGRPRKGLSKKRLLKLYDVQTGRKAV
ncbi:hypothetical protein JR316_0003132 [Psilocybe cubensis]|uniref:Uncharacterized protein n=2 Tax=Psilocybe cubensis TaxID=181762 RepID=A0A8H7Y4M2_PSICU|nr:hypothetical protein JR316_0003132 [Psilocybe cubensis]KAH9483662.1 hypothetical protein JR316_0003132 [Psilocybe cubensis]